MIARDTARRLHSPGRDCYDFNQARILGYVVVSKDAPPSAQLETLEVGARRLYTSLSLSLISLYTDHLKIIARHSNKVLYVIRRKIHARFAGRSEQDSAARV